MEPSKEEILAGYSRARHALDAWLDGAADADLRRRSNGTRWTNEELLFHMVFGYTINYWGSRAAALAYNRHRMARKLGKTITAISRTLERESAQSMTRSMPFPERWDPFFTPRMTVNDVYAYPTLHFDFHAKQLSL